MAIAVALVLLVVGSVVFHFMSPWWFTPIASNWGSIDFTINLTFWVTGAVFIAVNLFMAYCVYRFRHKAGQKAVYEPENAKLEIGLSAVTAVGVIAMLAPGLFVWATFVTVPEEATEYEVVGQQWQWSYRYPGNDGILGTVDTRHISESNPFGMNPDDPNGQDDILVKDPEMYLPVGKPVKALLRSKDVLHNYTVPQFRVKMDLVPGMVTYLWFTPTVVGSYDILCEELCGIGHHVMRGKVVVAEQADYDAWLSRQPTYAQLASMAAPNIVAGQQQYAVCASCHGQQGEGLQAMNAPKLNGLQSWYIERQLKYYQQGVRGAHPDDQYGRQMAPMASMLSTDDAVRNVAAYISQLPVTNSPDTVSGNVSRGMRIYNANCAACHGKNGLGSWATDAPNLVGMSDWYAVIQLNNFKAKIRGAHSDDDYGEQMVSMATAMRNPEQVNDVVAYINSLR
ncbi:MAG: c-type cytochrome [Gammaproteobacteria bacterium]|nr:c-type cytochrome [Gammaproteobacteria bacterium]MDP2139704.1 c-type cytochrome [Gammaproteobacteria bacterium]MDP2348908.1 c-type cytochrome [Gammaproteobacteria bacterium]